MCTESILNKSKKRLKYLYSKSKMIESIYKENPTHHNRQSFFEISDNIDDEMCIFYSNYLFWLKTQENPLFETYLALKKENVKKNLLANLISEWNLEKENEPTIHEQKFNRNV